MYFELKRKSFLLCENVYNCFVIERSNPHLLFVLVFSELPSFFLMEVKFHSDHRTPSMADSIVFGVASTVSKSCAYLFPQNAYEHLLTSKVN
jgi:hypothetical protein